MVSINAIKTDDNYPYFYLKEYASFVQKIENKAMVFFTDEYNTTIVGKISKNKFLKLIQPIYPPLSNSAERLNKRQELDFLNKWVSFITKTKMVDRIIQP